MWHNPVAHGAYGVVVTRIPVEDSSPVRIRIGTQRNNVPPVGSDVH